MLEQILASVKSLEEKHTEETTASIAATMKESIKALDAEWKANRDSALKQKDEAEAKMTELYAQVEKMGKTLSEAQNKLWQMEENSRATQTLIRYNARMSAMQEDYEMDDEDCATIASKLKTLEVKDTEDGKDEVFAAFQSEMAKLWKHKNKASIAKFKEDAKAAIDAEVKLKLEEISKAGEVKAGEEKKATEDALDNAKASAESVINNNESSSTNETLVDRWKKQFTKASITVVK